MSCVKLACNLYHLKEKTRHLQDALEKANESLPEFLRKMYNLKRKRYGVASVVLFRVLKRSVV